MIDRFVSPFFFRTSRWPFNKTLATRLDAIQCKMVRHVIRIPPLAHESSDTFHRRASKAVKHICRERGLWSVRWARAVISWGCHIIRNSSESVWCYPLLSIRTRCELEARRTEFSGRPGTRAQSGFIRKRWPDSLPAAMEYLQKSFFPN